MQPIKKSKIIIQQLVLFLVVVKIGIKVI